METAEYAKYAESGKGGSGLFRILWAGCVALLVYVLSIGPVMRSRLGDYPFINHVYAPLFAVCYRVPAAEGILSWYLFVVWNVPVHE